MKLYLIAAILFSSFIAMEAVARQPDCNHESLEDARNRQK